LKIHNSILTVLALYVVLFSGCSAVNPLVPYYENNFSGFEASKSEAIKSTPVKKSFHGPYEDVWSNTLYVLGQHSMIVGASKEEGIITFVSVEGVSFGSVFTGAPFYYWDFPFTVFIERGNEDITVYVCPMKELYNERDKKKYWWKVIDVGFNQLGEGFLDRLSTQMTTRERWRWMRVGSFKND